MNLNGANSPSLTGGRISVPEAQARTLRALRQYQVNRTETTIAFKQAVLKLAGYGNSIDGYY